MTASPISPTNRVNPRCRSSFHVRRNPNILACQQIDTAIQACGALIDANPTESEALAWAYNNRGIAAAAKGDLLNAIADYSKAIELAPQYDLQVAILDQRNLDRLPENFLPGMLLEVPPAKASR